MRRCSSGSSHETSARARRSLLTSILRELVLQAGAAKGVLLISIDPPYDRCNTLPGAIASGTCRAGQIFFNDHAPSTGHAFSAPCTMHATCWITNLKPTRERIGPAAGHMRLPWPESQVVAPAFLTFLNEPTHAAFPVVPSVPAYFLAPLRFFLCRDSCIISRLYKTKVCSKNKKLTAKTRGGFFGSCPSSSKALK